MTDREMLERSAKAAGFERLYWEGESMIVGPVGKDRIWQPLESDGDALRLAVKLRMFIELESLMAQAGSHEWFGGGDDEEAGMSPDECDPCAATRRAIVRAAAALGAQ